MLKRNFKITEELVEGSIKSEYYHVVPGTTMTLCVLTLTNGFQVTGESACVSPENFKAELGRNLARKMATGKVADYCAFMACDIRTAHEG